MNVERNYQKCILNVVSSIHRRQAYGKVDITFYLKKAINDTLVAYNRFLPMVYDLCRQ
jgi:hypothetical protein